MKIFFFNVQDIMDFRAEKREKGFEVPKQDKLEAQREVG